MNRFKNILSTIRHASGAIRFVSDVVINSMAQLVSQIRGLIVLPIIAIGLSVTDYGVWSQTMATSLLLLPFFILGLDQAAVRYLSGKIGDKRGFAESFFGMLLLILSVCFVIVLCALPFQSGISSIIYGSDNRAFFVVLMFLLVMGQVCFRYLLNFWRITRRIGRHATIRMSMDVMLVLGLVVIVVWLKLGVMAGIMYWICLNCIMSMVLLVAILRKIPFCWPHDFRIVLPYISYSSPLVMYAVANWMINSSSRYFVVNNFDLTQAGIYSAAFTLSTIATSAKVPLNFILLPTLSKMWSEGEKKDVRRYTEVSIVGYFIIAVPLVVLLAAGAPIFLKLFVGVVVPDGRLIMSLIAVGFLFTGLDQFFRNILMLQERTVRLVVSLLPATILNLVLNSLLIPRYGIIGAAYSVVISMAFKSQVLYWQALREFKFSVNIAILAKIMLASVTMIIVVYMLDVKSISGLIFGACLGLVLYLISLFLLGVLKVNDFLEVFKIFGVHSKKVTGSKRDVEDSV